jgi:hypothetical protein
VDLLSTKLYFLAKDSFKKNGVKKMEVEKENKIKKRKEENWIDELMEKDIDEEEEILSTVPNRLRHKLIGDDE